MAKNAPKMKKKMAQNGQRKLKTAQKHVAKKRQGWANMWQENLEKPRNTCQICTKFAKYGPAKANFRKRHPKTPPNPTRKHEYALQMCCWSRSIRVIIDGYVIAHFQLDSSKICKPKIPKWTSQFFCLFNCFLRCTQIQSHSVPKSQHLNGKHQVMFLCVDTGCVNDMECLGQKWGTLFVKFHSYWSTHVTIFLWWKGRGYIWTKTQVLCTKINCEYLNATWIFEGNWSMF